MKNRYQFPAMVTPVHMLAWNSPEWCSGISMKLQSSFDRLSHSGIEPLVGVLQDIEKSKPWLKFPEKKPIKRADKYCELVLGVSWKPVLAAIKESEPELHARLMSCVNPQSGNQYTVDHDNIMKPEQGTSESYSLNRLKREDTGLFNQVVAGELSAHAAMLEAGLRKPTRTVRVDSAEAAITALLRVFTKEELMLALEKPHRS